MLAVECIDSSNSNVLVEGAQYYAFLLPDKEHAYISRFPREKSHTGCFQLSRFKVIQNEIIEQLTLVL